MNIEERLREDAARFASMPAPGYLRQHLKAALDAVPVPHRSSRAVRPVRTWFVPAVAVLTLAMAALILSAGVDTGQYMPLLTSSQSQDRAVYAPEQSEAMVQGLSWDHNRKAAAIFGGLAVAAGALCLVELKGRPRLLVLALSALALLTASGLLLLLR